MADAVGGDACIALALLRPRITAATMGDASVPTLPPSHSRPYETTPLPSSFHKNLPLKEGRAWPRTRAARIAEPGDR